MKKHLLLIATAACVTMIPVSAFAQAGTDPSKAQQLENVTPGTLAPHPSMKEDTDGVLQAGEYEVISTNGSVTRSTCPYTCEMRGLPKEKCRTWPSKQDPTKCYIEDTSKPSGAVPLGK